MAVKNTPIAISTRNDHDAADLRQAVVAGFAGGADMKPVGGIVPGWGNELAVTVGSGLAVSVAAGLVLIPAPAAAEGGWLVPNDGLLTVPLAAAHPSNARIDRLIVRVSDGQYHAGADNQAAIEVITGTAAGSPTLPTVPSGKGEYIELRRIAVAANATTLIPANVTTPPSGVPFASRVAVKPVGFTPTVRAQTVSGATWPTVSNAGTYTDDGTWIEGTSTTVIGPTNGPSFEVVQAQFVSLPAPPPDGFRGSLGTFAYTTEVGEPRASGDIVFGFNGTAYARLVPAGSAGGFATSNAWHLMCNWHYPAA